MKQRYARIKLLYGGYVGASGRPTSYARIPAIFRWEDAQQFLREAPMIDKSHYLWGASIEMLEKRKPWVPITEEQFKRMLGMTMLVWLETEIARYEQQANQASAEAKRCIEQAVKYKMKAAEIKERLKKETA